MSEASEKPVAEPRTEAAPPVKQAQPTSEVPSFRRRMTTAFGWVAGVALGVLLNYGIYAVVGESYPQVPTTFVAVVAGAFSGMGLADRLGERGFRPLGIAAGVLLALFAWLVVAVLLSPPDTAPT